MGGALGCCKSGAPVWKNKEQEGVPEQARDEKAGVEEGPVWLLRTMGGVCMCRDGKEGQPCEWGVARGGRTDWGT